MNTFPARQVHLDFHTSPLIPGVAEQFDKTQFQQALKEGHVNSITVFAKCHHGYCYYPTTVGTPHPTMAPGRDFAGELMDACHEIGVRAPLYIPIGWSALDAEEHPEWIMRDKDGSFKGAGKPGEGAPEDPRPFVSWFTLCSAGGYRQYLLDLTEEICRRYDRLDGLFYDITIVKSPCYCESCKAGMRRLGMDPDSEADAKAYFDIQKKVTFDAIREILFRYHPDATIFFNSGGADILRPQWLYASTHYEMEYLPTVWGGYDKLPMRMCYLEDMRKPCVGMTGKFHLAWGEFGGYKTPEALRYECAAILSYGAAISIGDQMPPSGKMDLQTYRNIGQAYAYAASIEDYCFEGVQTARLGVPVSPKGAVNDAVTKLILDSGLDFGVIRTECDLQKFDTVILPDGYRVSPAMGTALEGYLAAGGKLLMLGGSGLKPDSEEFAFPCPFRYEGRSGFDSDYLQLTEDAPGLFTAPVYCYTPAHRVSGEGQVLAQVRDPYFSRTYAAYCSHRNAPYTDVPAGYPGAIRSGNILYAAHELATLYADYGVTYHRRCFLYLLRQLYTADPVIVRLPSQGRHHMIHRTGHRQYVLHLLYASPVQRGQACVLEDFPTLYNIPVTLNVPEVVQSATLIPQNTQLPLTRDETGLHLTVPELTAHQMVVFTY